MGPLEDELCCLYASARFLTGYLKPQREAAQKQQLFTKLTDRWILGHADDNDKEQTDLLVVVCFTLEMILAVHLPWIATVLMEFDAIGI